MCVGRRRRARARGGLRAPVRGRHGGQDRDAGGRAQPRDAHRAADGRPAADRRGPEGDHDRRQRAARARAPLRRRSGEDGIPLGARPRRGPSPTPSSRSTTTPASSATAASAPATTSRATTSSAAPARATRRRIAFDLERPDGRVDLRHVRRVRGRLPDRRARQQADPRRPDPAARASSTPVDTVCPYCGVGCALTYHVDRRARTRSSFAEGRDQPGSQRPAVREGPLRLGLRAPRRSGSPTPLIRRERVYPKGPLSADVRGEGRGRRKQAGRPRRLRRGACRTSARRRWDEALDLVASRLKEIHADARPRRDRRLRLGEVLQRGGLPLPEADPRRLRHQQRRPLHAAVPRLVRRGAVRGHRLGRGLDDLRRHRQRRRRDPHRHEHDREPPGRGDVLQAGAAARHEADRRRPAPASGSPTTPTSTARSSPAPTSRSTTAMMHEIIARGLVDREFVARAHDELRRARQDGRSTTRPSAPRRSAASTPTRSARSRGCGARPAPASSSGAWASRQHTTGTDNARCLIALCSITGNVGRPGTGLHPLRGQNNVQGASDAGLIPMMYPDYQRVDDRRRARAVRGGLGPRARSRAGPDRHRDHRLRRCTGGMRGMYMMGENPFLSDPNINKVRKALSRARVPRRAGHLPDRDRRVRRRGPARHLVPGEGVATM